MRITVIIGLIVAMMLPVIVQATSFSADAVQIRNGEFSHARMYWSDGRVRFEYLEDGVSMAQIYDIPNKKVIWLDVENKLFMVKALASEQALEPILRKNETSSNPCDLMQNVECTQLKNVHINGREAVKWLITSQYQGQDFHTFQWIDKEYEVIVRQENLDGSLFEVIIDDDQEMNGRKVRKHDIYMISNGKRSHGVQWYDTELNMVVRQHYQDGTEDELRNIRVEQVANQLFTVPDDYVEYGSKPSVVEAEKLTMQTPVGPVNQE